MGSGACEKDGHILGVTPTYTDGDNLEEDQENRWQRVNHRKNNRSGLSSTNSNEEYGRSGIQKTIPNSEYSILNRMSMNFYITNFPSQITKKEIWNRCAEYGTIADIYISSRRSKLGKNFGFVRFTKVDNAAKLLSRLRDTWFGNLRMYADVEKYSRKTKPVQAKTDVKKDGDTQAGITNHQKNSNGKSYAAAVSGDSGKDSSNPPARRTVRVFACESVKNSSESCAMLAKLVEVENVPFVRQWLHVEGFIDFEVKYLGGRWILLDFPSSDVKDKFLASDTLKGRFSVFKSPSDSFVPDERMVWVEISGVPYGVWNKENFQTIIGSWGKCVFFGPEWLDSYSMGKVCILSHSAKFIFEELKVILEDKTFDVWIREFAVWEPSIRKVKYASSFSSEESVSQCDSDNSFGSDTIVEENGINSLSAHVDNSGNGLESDDRSARSASFDPDLCKDHSVGDRDNDVVEDNADVILENNHNTCIPEVAEELSSLDRCSVKEERSVHHNNGLDDHDVFLLNRLLHQDKCRVRPVRDTVNEILKASSESSLKQDQSINESTGSGKQKKVGDQLFSSVVSPSTPPVTDLNPSDQSSSTWLDYVGPITTDELDPEKYWSYKDPSGNVQGPFSLVELNKWKDYFPSDFKIWRYYGSVKDTVLLHSALKRRTKDVG